MELSFRPILAIGFVLSGIVKTFMTVFVVTGTEYTVLRYARATVRVRE